jgi:hypothetical protein
MSVDWKVVTKKDKKRVMRRRGTPAASPAGGSRSRTFPNGDCHRSVEVRKTDCESLLARCQQELETLLIPESVLEAAPMEVKRFDAATRLVCYGIGNFSECSASYFSASTYQLALALYLRRAWRIRKCYYLDPCITAVEREVLVDQSVEILDNRQGRQSFLNDADADGENADCAVLFFMPHCPKQLYENVVWAHFEELSRVFILGNSLRNYVDALGVRCDGLEVSSPPSPQQGSHLEAIYPIVREFPLHFEKDRFKSATGNLEGALNDTYWTTFAREQYVQVPRTLPMIGDLKCFSELL